MTPYEIIVAWWTVSAPLMWGISITVMIGLHFGYRNMYLRLRKRWIEQEIKYRALCESTHQLRQEFIDAQLQIKYMKEIYEGCKEAERDTGVKVDFDGNVQITRVAQDGKEAVAQMNEIDRLYYERIKKIKENKN